MPDAARVTDPVSHPVPPVLGPGPGSSNVLIGGLPAWRGVDAAAAAALQAFKSLYDAELEAIEATLTEDAEMLGDEIAEANAQAARDVARAVMSVRVGQMAGGADIHTCATPAPPHPHGLGVVIDGSMSVLINDLPATRQGDTILEVAGPPNTIALGFPTVSIGG